MERFLLVCIGGAVGTGARYLVATTAPRLLGASFPYGTFIVSTVVLCLLAGATGVASARWLVGS
jgi:CrcB protein